MAEQADAQATADAIRKDALMAAVRVICPQCADDRPLDNNGSHTAKEGGGILLPVGQCVAWPIHQLMGRDNG